MRPYTTPGYGGGIDVRIAGGPLLRGAPSKHALAIPVSTASMSEEGTWAGRMESRIQKQTKTMYRGMFLLGLRVGPILAPTRGDRAQGFRLPLHGLTRRSLDIGRVGSSYCLLQNMRPRASVSTRTRGTSACNIASTQPSTDTCESSAFGWASCVRDGYWLGESAAHGIVVGLPRHACCAVMNGRLEAKSIQPMTLHPRHAQTLIVYILT